MQSVRTTCPPSLLKGQYSNWDWLSHSYSFTAFERIDEHVSFKRVDNCAQYGHPFEAGISRKVCSGSWQAPSPRVRSLHRTVLCFHLNKHADPAGKHSIENPFLYNSEKSGQQFCFITLRRAAPRHDPRGIILASLTAPIWEQARELGMSRFTSPTNRRAPQGANNPRKEARTTSHQNPQSHLRQTHLEL